MRRLLRVLACCCVAAAGLVVVTPSPSGAEAPDAVGWWSKQLPTQDDSRESDSPTDEVTGQSAGSPVRFGSAGSPAQVPDTTVDTTIPEGPITTGPLPVNPPTLPEPPITTPDPGTGAPNPTVPEGGLWVSNNPTGPMAVSALRYRGDIGSGQLILTIAPGSTIAGPVVACPIISGWSPGPEGAWRDRPAIDCDRFELTGRLDTETGQLRFTIPQGFTEFGERVLDIGIRPAVGAGDAFDLYFEAPGPESFVVFGGQELPPPETELPEPDESTLPTTAPDTTIVAARDEPGTTSSTTEAQETAAPVDIGGDGTPQPVSDVLEPLTESRAARIFAVSLLLLLGLGMWYLSNQEVRQPRLLGALAGSESATRAAAANAPKDQGRGIGRFRRERTGPPTKF